jgi:hypothetical protein
MNNSLYICGDCSVHIVHKYWTILKNDEYKDVSYGGIKKIKDLKKGDKILLQEGFGIVKCIIKYTVNNVILLSCNIKIGVYNKIFIDEKWIYPNDLDNKEVIYDKTYVYSIILEEKTDYGILVNNVPISHLMCVNEYNKENTQNIIRFLENYDTLSYLHGFIEFNDKE